jgi:hypothetical protein
MALPPASPERQLKHRRQIDVQVFACDDGLWEVDARITDVKTHDTRLGHHIRPAGEPVHDLLLRLVINDNLDILDAGSQSSRMPHPGVCDQLGDTYERLIGLNLMRGFRQALKERVGGVRGCTHLTEMAQTLPTAVMQALADQPNSVFNAEDPTRQPLHINGCHAQRADGPVVREHYPRWYRPATSDTPTPSATAVPSPLSELEQESVR